MSNVYALFVGINKYQAVTPLSGCVEDIAAIEKLFTTRIAPESLKLLSLLDGQATRAAIIDGFSTHLSRARDDDVALFFYCGHGSTEPSPAEWRHSEPSGQNQTIVPVDARTSGVYDIADKELTALIHGVREAAQSDRVQVVVITDSCHSGGNTRGGDDPNNAKAGVGRMTAAAKASGRTLNDYLELARTLFDPERVTTSGPPRPRHVALAACQDNEIAKEFPLQPPRRGAFSLAFEETVRTLGPAATYTALINAVRMKVRDRAEDQVPNLYVSGGASGSDLFLGGQAGRNDLTIDADTSGRWWLSAGAIDGIPSPDTGSVTEVAVDERRDRVATAVVVAVLPDRAQLNVSPGGAALDPLRQYIGTITRLGTPALQVVIDAAPRVRSRLAGSSPLFAVVDQAGKVPFVTALVSSDAVQVQADGAPLTGLRYGLDDRGLSALTASCSHLARWYGVRDLAPAGSQLNGQVRVELVPVAATEKVVPDDRPAHPAPNGTLSLAYDGSKGPRVQCRLRNDSKERLYVALLDLNDSFECSKLFGDWIPAGGTGMALDGKAFRLELPAWRDASVRSTTDYFKVIAAISDFDPERWTMPALLGPASRAVVIEDEPRARTADGIDAFWGTTVLKVETTR